MRWAVVFIALCLTTLVPSAAFAKTKAPTYTRLFYYQGGALARKSFFAHPGYVDIFAPQTYGIDETGALSGGLDPVLIDFAHNHGIKIMPLVTNKSFSQTAYQALLDDPSKQTAAIAALVAEAKSQDYWGWQFDFEQMDASDKDKFSAFVAAAYTAMQRNDLKLSVAVIAKTSDVPEDYPNNLYERLIGVYDYTAIAQNSDFVSVMSYDDPTSKGPVTGYAWLQSVLAYSMAHIPKNKISLGLGFYYWQWDDALGKRIGIGGNEGIQNVLKKHKAVQHYSFTEQAPYLRYSSKSMSYTIWFENKQSVARKISLITSNNLYGFSAWALGLEVPSVYGAIRK